MRLPNFTDDEIVELYAQHTAETGQAFTPEASALAFELTGGQPWLVNALADEAITREVPDRGVAIERRHIEVVRETLIRRRETHLDSLLATLRERRVQRIVEPILAGRFLSDEALDDDIRFVTDLGLVVAAPLGLGIANPIYREIVPRALTAISEQDLPVARAPFIDDDGGLRFTRLIDGLIEFWREHAEHFLGRQPYAEAAAQLVCMALLHRLVNGRTPAGQATIDREYAAGSGRTDLLIRWPMTDGTQQRYAFELKVRRDGDGDQLAEGLAQLDDYLARLGLDSGTLILFDQRSDAPPLPERIEREQRDYGGRRILVLRL